VPPALPPPSRADRSWLASVLGADENTMRVRRLDGGITSAVHDVAVLDAKGEPRHYVLRRYTGTDHESPAADVRREAASLTRLATSELPVPRLVGVDAEAEHCSAPALLMTRLPGRILLRPADPDDWLRQMAALLPRIHATQVDAPPANLWLDPAELTTPDWSSDDGMWQAAFDLFHSGPPDGDRCFIHRDYQQFNLLWTGQALSGVVDWVHASYGSPDIDVAHCRLNLTVVYSAELAARFLSRYEAVAGRRVEPWWDVAGLLVYLPGWGEFLQRQAGRRLTIDFAGMHARVEASLRAALDRAAGP
jgi:aminoglycoside phosphotransferase (APT) family kinase protein